MEKLLCGMKTSIYFEFNIRLSTILLILKCGTEKYACLPLGTPILDLWQTIHDSWSAMTAGNSIDCGTKQKSVLRKPQMPASSSLIRHLITNTSGWVSWWELLIHYRTFSRSSCPPSSKSPRWCGRVSYRSFSRWGQPDCKPRAEEGDDRIDTEGMGPPRTKPHIVYRNHGNKWVRSL